MTNKQKIFRETIFFIISIVIAFFIVCPAVSATTTDIVLDKIVYDNATSNSYPSLWPNETDRNNYCINLGKTYSSDPTTHLIYYSNTYSDSSSYIPNFVLPTNSYKAFEYIRCYEIGHIGDNNYRTNYAEHYYDYHQYVDNLVNFSATSTSGDFPLSTSFSVQNVLFNDDIIWSFGDGNITTISGNTISHTYKEQGVYTVSMEYTNIFKEQKTLTKINYINVTNPSYYITVSPAWIPADGTQYLYGQLHSATVGENFSQTVEYITWSWAPYINGIAGSSQLYYNTTNSDYIHSYKRKTDGYFYQYNVNVADFTNKMSSIPNPVSLNPIGGTGTIITYGDFGFTNGDRITYTLTNQIGDPENTTINKVTISPRDGYTGYQIKNVQLSFKNTKYGNWTNVTTTNYLDQQFLIPVNDPFIVYASSTGYLTTSKSVTSAAENGTYTISMYPENQEAIDKATVIISANYGPVYNSVPISGITIAISNPLNSSEKYYGSTNSNGIYTAYLNFSRQYQVTASGNSYTTVTTIFNTGTSSTSNVDLYLSLKPTTTTAIPGDVVTITTPSPVLTPSAWASGNKTTCVAILPSGATPIDNIKNGIACMGVDDAQSQSLFLAALICFVFILVGSKYGKGMGAAFGGITGFVFDLAMGLIPFWVFAALLVLTGLAIAIYALSGK